MVPDFTPEAHIPDALRQIHLVMVPGVGGSEKAHWQSWLQRTLPLTSRVEQDDWQQPILGQWVARLHAHVLGLDGQRPVVLVAHSFGCLTALQALQDNTLRQHISGVLLVAAANPVRFDESGFAAADAPVDATLQRHFEQVQCPVPARLVTSANDPWLSYPDALHYAQCWGIDTRHQGAAGHINVASGFGPFPQVIRDLTALLHLPH